ncbi:hypothetical protein B0H14DRAFT_57855 [Mycena olivaceomarginata]|nr:hypothetical protein B0H14DRAFT_57855 [Mycena olivaceomarginata]
MTASSSASFPSSHPIPTEPRLGLIDLRAPAVRRTTRGAGPLLRLLARPANSNSIDRASLISSPYLTPRLPKLWPAFHHCTANPPRNATLRRSHPLTLFLQHRLGINHHIFLFCTTNSTHPHTHARDSMKRGAAATIHAIYSRISRTLRIARTSRIARTLPSYLVDFTHPPLSTPILILYLISLLNLLRVHMATGYGPHTSIRLPSTTCVISSLLYLHHTL